MKNQSGRKLIRIAVCAIAASAILTAAINIHVVSSVSSLIVEETALTAEESRDLIVVLGTRVNDEGQPQEMLMLRLDKTTEGYGNMILCSGDNRPLRNRETDAMTMYLTDKGIDSEHIICDEKGYNTYGSISGLRDDHSDQSVILITQKYHLCRALYIARSMGIDAIGVAAEDMTEGMLWRNGREILARVKDFFLCLFD